MVLDLGFLEIGDSGMGVWVCCWWCCRRGCGFVGGVASVGVGLLVVFLAWVCRFDGGAAGVGVWV